MAMAGVATRAERRELGRGDGGMEGETTRMGGAVSTEAASEGARSTPGGTAGVTLDLRAYDGMECETTRMGGTKSTEGAGDGARSALGKTAGVALCLRARDEATEGTGTGDLRGDGISIEGTGEARREPGTAGLPSWLGCAYGEA